MDGLTIQEAAETTGWSSRMLRYIEREGLIAPRRSESGYRLYGPEELQRLRTLRELLQEHDMSLGDAGFALRLSREAELKDAVEAWLEAAPPSRRTCPHRTGCGGSRRSTSVCLPRRPPSNHTDREDT